MRCRVGNVKGHCSAGIFGSPLKADAPVVGRRLEGIRAGRPSQRLGSRAAGGVERGSGPEGLREGFQAPEGAAPRPHLPPSSGEVVVYLLT
jgi:hypothetical protein